ETHGLRGTCSTFGWDAIVRLAQEHCCAPVGGRSYVCKPRSHRSFGNTLVVGGISATMMGLVFSGLLSFAPQVYAQDQRDVRVEPEDTNSVLHADVAEIGALRDYAWEIGFKSPAKDSKPPHPHFGAEEFAALREYASDIGIEVAPGAATSE